MHLLRHGAEVTGRRGSAGIKVSVALVEISERCSGETNLEERVGGTKGACAATTLHGPEEIELLNWSACIMHNEQRPKGGRDREETSCHHWRRAMERWTKEMSRGAMHSFCMAAYPSPWKLCMCVCVCVCALATSSAEGCVLWGWRIMCRCYAGGLQLCSQEYLRNALWSHSRSCVCVCVLQRERARERDLII